MVRVRGLLAFMACLVCLGCIDSNGTKEEDNDISTCIGDHSCSKASDAPELTLSIRDACEDTEITNLLNGSCWWEMCVKHEKSLYPKITGAPCVYVPKSINSPWVEGTCNGEGICVGTIP